MPRSGTGRCTPRASARTSRGTCPSVPGSPDKVAPMARTPDSPDEQRAPGQPADDGAAAREGEQLAPGPEPLDAAEVAARRAGQDGAARRVPSEEELGRVAVDVRIRRRPRYGVFIALGIVVAAVAAFVWATSVPQEQHVNWGATVWVTTLGAAGFGALAGAGAGVLADWVSRRGERDGEKGGEKRSG